MVAVKGSSSEVAHRHVERVGQPAGTVGAHRPPRHRQRQLLARPAVEGGACMMVGRAAKSEKAHAAWLQGHRLSVGSETPGIQSRAHKGGLNPSVAVRGADRGQTMPHHQGGPFRSCRGAKAAEGLLISRVVQRHARPEGEPADAGMEAREAAPALRHERLHPPLRCAGEEACVRGGAGGEAGGKRVAGVWGREGKECVLLGPA